jgi:hypothetical protein
VKVRVFFFSIIIFSAFFFSANTTFAAVKCWVGPAGGNWSTAANWQTTAGVTSALTSADIATFDPGKVTCTGAATTDTNSTIDTTAAGTVGGIDIKSSYTQTITQTAGITVTVGASNYSQAGGTYTATTGTFDDNGTFSLSAGTFTPPTTANTYAKDFTISGTGNYNIGASATTTIDTASVNSTITVPGVLGGFVVIDKNRNQTITVATGTTIHLGSNATTTFSASGGYSGKLINNGTMIVDGGTWTVNGSYVAGDFTNNGTIIYNGTTWTIHYAFLVNNGTITHNGNALTDDTPFINNTNATFTMATGTWTQSSGSITNSGTINYSGSLLTVTAGAITNSNIINYSSSTAISIGSDLNNTGTINSGATTTFNSAATSTITCSDDHPIPGVVVITKGITTAVHDLVIVAGCTIDLGTNPVTTTGGATNIVNYGTITVSGGTWTWTRGLGTYGGFGYIKNYGIINHYGTGWIINANNTNDTGGARITNYEGATINYSGTTLSMSQYFSGSYSNITNDGTFNATSLVNATTSGSITNTGTMTFGNSLLNLSAYTLTNSGTVTYGTSTAINVSTDLTYTGTINNGATTTFVSAATSTVTCSDAHPIPGVVSLYKGITGAANPVIITAGCTINLGNNPSFTTGGGTKLINYGTITVSGGTWTWTRILGTYGLAGYLNNYGTINHYGSGWTTIATTTNDNNGFGINNYDGGVINYAGTSLIISSYASGNYSHFVNNGTFNSTSLTSGTINGSITNTGTINFAATTSLSVSGSLTQSGIITGLSTTTLVGGANTVSGTSTIPGTLIINKTAVGTVQTIGSDITVNNFIHTQGTISASSKIINLTGNLTIANTTYVNAPTLTFNFQNGNDQNLTINSGSFYTPITINKTGTARVILATTTTTGSGSAATITVNSGALYLNGKTLSATTTINSGGELQIQGSENFTTPTLNTGSTFTYVGNGDGLPNNYFLNTDLAYSNLKINSIDDNDNFDATIPVGYGLAGYWKFDNDDTTAIDRTGVNNGTYINGAVSSSTSGKFGKGVYLDGVDDYVQINNSTLLNGATALTMSAWVNVRQFGSADGIFCTRGTRVHCLSSGVGTFWSYIDNTGAGSVITYNTGDWYFITGRWLGLKSQIFVNGQKIADSSNLLTTSISVDDYWKIGWDDFQTSRYTDGSIDEVRIYGRTLSDSEILDLYNYNGIDNTYLNLNGSLTVSNGTLVASTTNLIMSGASSTISLNATTTFASLTAGSTTASTTLNFGTTGNLVITGTTTLQGTSTMPLTLRSTTPGESWHFTPDGPRVLGYLDVQDSYNHSTDINAMSYTSITNSGNNTGWTFTVPLLTISHSGTQLSTTTAIINNQDLGGAFTLTPSGGDFTLSALKLHQAGSFPIEDISDIRIYSEATTTCSATKPSYLSDYATTTTFDASKVSTTTFYTPVTLPTGTTTCLYITYDLSGTAGTSTMGRTIDLEISNPSLDVTAITGSITPTRSINISGTTMIPADNEVIVPAFPTLATTTNPNCSSNEITSLLSLTMPREAKNPTLYYLQNCAVYKQVGTTTARRISPLSMQVHDLSFEKMSGGNVRISITASNMDPGQENTFMNVTRTLSTSATVRVWRGN